MTSGEYHYIYRLWQMEWRTMCETWPFGRRDTLLCQWREGWKEQRHPCWGHSGKMRIDNFRDPWSPAFLWSMKSNNKEKQIYKIRKECEKKIINRSERTRASKIFRSPDGESSYGAGYLYYHSIVSWGFAQQTNRKWTRTGEAEEMLCNELCV